MLNTHQSQPNWRLIRYEKLASRPVEEFRNLYRGLGLEWRPEIEDWILGHTQSSEPGTLTVRKSAEQIWRWTQKLSSEEVASIRRVLEPFDLGIYASPAEWNVPAASKLDLAQ